MTIKSNLQGRALEYKICIVIHSFFQNSVLSTRAKKDNKRDQKLFQSLEAGMKDDFSKCADIVVKWLQKKLDSNTVIQIDRLPDASGVVGDPTDIRIGFDSGGIINLSIKNRYPALKHQRLSRLPYQCNITDVSKHSKYSENLSKIWEEFFSRIVKTHKGATLYNEVSDLTFKHLYYPLNKLVVSFLNSNKSSAQSFFKFLTSRGEFYMVKNGRNSVTIYDFSKIKYPKNMIAKTINDNNILLIFDNGWEFNLRLHTASSRLYLDTGTPNRSIKVDTTFPSIEKWLDIVVYDK